MAWRDTLRRAKLGNAPFLVQSSDANLGRNTEVHEYPQRDKPFTEDLGRKARRFTIEAYVMGPDYMVARDALIVEIESKGNKTLVHPYLGEQNVTLIDSTGPRESTNEGGMARFTLTFVEAGEQQFPSATLNTSKNVAEKASSSTDLSIAAFVNKFDPASTPDFILDSATSQVRDVTQFIQSSVARIATTKQGLSSFVASLSDLSAAAPLLVIEPATLALRTVTAIAQIQDIAATPLMALIAVRGLFKYGSDLPFIPMTTSNRIIEAKNQAAIKNLVRQAAVISAASISATVDFASEQDALAVRDELIAAIDDQLEQVGDFELDFPITDEEYSSLVDIRTAAVIDLESRGAKLAQLVPLTLIESTAAIVVSYDRYLTTARDEEIIARNMIDDPVFLPSGRRLQVLSDG